jgi:hypothetical protein
MIFKIKLSSIVEMFDRFLPPLVIGIIRSRSAKDEMDMPLFFFLGNEHASMHPPGLINDFLEVRREVFGIGLRAPCEQPISGILDSRNLFLYTVTKNFYPKVVPPWLL